MKSSFHITLLALTLTATTACAEDLSPGQWQITLESKVAGDAGWAPPPFNLNQCLTANDARDPSALISSISTPGATGCNYTEKSYSGNTLRFALDCAGTLSLKTRGSVTFSANSFDGNVTANTSLGGKPIVMQNRLSGKRLGGC